MSEHSQQVIPSSERKYYERIVYWNDFPQVQHWLNKLISGDEDKGWTDHVAKRFGRCNTALSLNCGNGWVEREFFQKNIINAVVGIDIGESLLAEARSAAQALGLPADYVMQDVNRVDLSPFKFDWAINHAALHHVAFIDHVIREIARGLPADGLLISYDYIGPHRNQYLLDAWQLVVELNDLAPEPYRITSDYPHVRTMVHVDPTEAVHSELIVETLSRYFETIEAKALGGAIAYPLLFKNNVLLAEAETPKGRAWIDCILREDREYTSEKLDRSLFGFIVSRPLKHVLDDHDQLRRWTEEERSREEHARQNSGRYYAANALEIIYERLYALKDRVAQLESRG